MKVNFTTHCRAQHALWLKSSIDFLLSNTPTSHGKSFNPLVNGFCLQSKHPQMHFSIFRQKTKIWWKSSFINYKYGKYLIFKKGISQFIRFHSKIRVNNLPRSRNFHNSCRQFPMAMSTHLCLFPCLTTTTKTSSEL